MFVRHPNNPLISPRDLQPSRPDFEIIGAFNAGATVYNGETLLLVRVAERPISASPDIVLVPYFDASGAITMLRVRRDDPAYDTHDPRMVGDRQNGSFFLTSLSHLRLARSHNGVSFTVEDHPWLHGQPPFETFGVEDARITPIEGAYYVNYTAVSPFGIATALVSTRDFVGIERHGLIFAPNNRDVTLFPEKIGGRYVCYHRPMPGSHLHIGLATSPDLIHWGDLRIVLESKSGAWDGGRVGGGAPPIKTDQGWLSIYHAADAQNRYCLGAFLTPLDAPDRIIARSQQPIFVPEAPYETNGFFGNVVFTCGALADGDRLRIYYGAADDKIALAETSITDLIHTLQPI
ncbi:MAG TPA: glycoside hydrolase family 130 protein [Phototrophicaceae bacterium]|nr:glycoside hydrolase family 130 protein [Phototrophicaceae bacterium]